MPHLMMQSALVCNMKWVTLVLNCIYLVQILFFRRLATSWFHFRIKAARRHCVEGLLCKFHLAIWSAQLSSVVQ